MADPVFPLDAGAGGWGCQIGGGGGGQAPTDGHSAADEDHPKADVGDI
jgi:hypothetical protein